MPLTNSWLVRSPPVKRLDRERLEERILNLLSSQNMCVLATSGPRGPLATPVRYSSLGFAILFTAAPRSPKMRNIGADPACLDGVFAPLVGRASSRGAQLFGAARILDPLHPDHAHYWAAFRWENEHAERGGRCPNHPPKHSWSLRRNASSTPSIGCDATDSPTSVLPRADARRRGDDRDAGDLPAHGARPPRGGGGGDALRAAAVRAGSPAPSGPRGGDPEARSRSTRHQRSHRRPDPGVDRGAPRAAARRGPRDRGAGRSAGDPLLSRAVHRREPPGAARPDGGGAERPSWAHRRHRLGGGHGGRRAGRTVWPLRRGGRVRSARARDRRRPQARGVARQGLPRLHAGQPLVAPAAHERRAPAAGAGVGARHRELRRRLLRPEQPRDRGAGARDTARRRPAPVRGGAAVRPTGRVSDGRRQYSPASSV